MNKKILFSSLLALGFIGCGGGGGTTSTTSSSYTDISVERGPVLGAYVVDNSGKRAYNISGNVYRFSTTPSYPVTSYGGYIDVNRDGVIDTTDAKINTPLSVNANAKVITVLTTIAQNSDIKNELLNTYNLSEDDINTLTPATSLAVSAISDEVFRYCVDNNTSADSINLTTFLTLKTAIQNIIDTNATSSSALLDIVIANETALVSDLNISLTDANLTEIQNTLTYSSASVNSDISSMVYSYPVYDLNDTQKDDLSYMYEEEKLARDVYTKMYELWGSKVFYNISKSEQTHMDAIKTLLEKYSLSIPSDTAGVYNDSTLQSLYNTLVSNGSVSLIEALNVGKLIEETDIQDLNDKMLISTDDVKAVYQSLLNGSYNHLNAFTKQLY